MAGLNQFFFFFSTELFYAVFNAQCLGLGFKGPGGQQFFGWEAAGVSTFTGALLVLLVATFNVRGVDGVIAAVAALDYVDCVGHGVSCS